MNMLSTSALPAEDFRFEIIRIKQSYASERCSVRSKGTIRHFSAPTLLDGQAYDSEIIDE